MQSISLHTPIEYLKGVGPQRADILKKEANIFTVEELLQYYPFRYVDKSQFHQIKDVRSDDAPVQIKGKIVDLKESGRPRQKRLVAVLQDETGQMELTWFKGVQWIKAGIPMNKEVVVYGKPKLFKNKYSISHPEISEPRKPGDPPPSLKPVYHSGEKLTAKGLNSNGFEKLIKTALAELSEGIEDPMPNLIKEKLSLINLDEAYQNIHFPRKQEYLLAAQNRLKFDELFYIQLGLIQNKQATTTMLKGVVFESVGEHFNDFYENHLPFELTNAQKRVLKEIRKDVRNGYHMNRLVQGDVGSGKTIVALLAALIAIDNGYQVCFMAPTEILARQHYATLTKMLGDTFVRVGILTGSTKTAERKELHAALQNGQIHILVGTHALIEPTVKFHNLGLAIIDEQHRFGVSQRAQLWKKSAIPPHVLVMTATPIPRTLAMTMYGDLDVSIIDELPPGRKQVQTIHRFESGRLKVFQFVEDEVKKGRQVYIVYPLIKESEAMDYKDLMDGYESISRRFPLPDYRISIVHGQMKPEDKDHEMQLFVKGETQIMVSTTVIEVGVDVPNASVMIIESAEKFGLSQLHQLRGRVGRGSDQSYCVLMSGHKLSNDAKTRLETMVRTTDGFEIAEVDLHLRGPGDIMGTQQSGILDMKIADLTKDQNILKTARHLAIQVIEQDPKLESDEMKSLQAEMSKLSGRRVDWSVIS